MQLSNSQDAIALALPQVNLQSQFSSIVHLSENTVQNHQPYNELSPMTVLNAIESIGYVTDARVLILNSFENRVYQVGIEEQLPVVLKFYRPERWSDAQILEEHHFSKLLQDRELPVVAPVFDEHGQSLYTFESFRFAVYPRKGGYAPEFDNLDNLYRMGRVIGRIHAIGAVEKYQHRPTLDIQSFAQNSADFLLQKDILPSGIHEQYKAISEPLINKLHQAFSHYDSEDNIRLHGDNHAGNILWRDDAPHFVDFDDSRMGPAIQDIWMLLSGDENRQRVQLSEIMDGYNEFYDFPIKQLSLIEPLRTLRLMHYSAWLARRWQDPIFPENFPWFNTDNYWQKHIADLQQQLIVLNEEPLSV